MRALFPSPDNRSAEHRCSVALGRLYTNLLDSARPARYGAVRVGVSAIVPCRRDMAIIGFLSHDGALACLSILPSTPILLGSGAPPRVEGAGRGWRLGPMV